MSLARIKYNLLEISAREVCKFMQVYRISSYTFSSLLSSTAAVRMAQTEGWERSCDFAPVRQFSPLLQFEFMVNNHRTSWVEWDLKDRPVPSPLPGMPPGCPGCPTWSWHLQQRGTHNNNLMAFIPEWGKHSWLCKWALLFSSLHQRCVMSTLIWIHHIVLQAFGRIWKTLS